MIRVGIDARLLTEAVTGIGRYTASMCRGLVQLDGRFFLYMPSAPSSPEWVGDGVSVRSGHARSRLARMAWSQTALPWEAATDRVDILWAATHRLPRYLPASIARVVTVHDLVWRHAPETMRPTRRWLDRFLMPDAVRLADRIIAVSHSTAQAIESEWPSSRGRVRVVYPGESTLPLPHDAPSIVDLGIDRRYVLFVGTLEPRKNLARLIAAFAALPETLRASTRLVIVGGKGWGAVDAGRLAAEHDIREQVIVMGYVDDARLAVLYANAYCLAMPSLYEGFGLPLIEAMTHGTPVIASNVSSLPEVVGDAGILVDPLDVTSIVGGLQRMLGDPSLRQRLAELAPANALRFSASRSARAAMDVFLEAIDERRTRRGHTD